jgi:hypothetical protein
MLLPSRIFELRAAGVIHRIGATGDDGEPEGYRGG